MIRIKLADDVKTISIKNKFEQVCFRSALRQNLLFNFIETEEKKKVTEACSHNTPNMAQRTVIKHV